MSRFKTLRVIFFIAALLLAAKPFIGFSLFGRINSPVVTNIFAKVFSKRKVDDSTSNMKAIQKQLSEPMSNLVLRFCFLLALLFPLAFKLNEAVTGQFLRRFQLSMLPQPINLFTGQLLI
ncbi:MAG: hypothetical protein ACXVAY_11875 [Mucilaginibacter sp.]